MSESYRKAGVDLQRLDALKEQIGSLVRATWNSQVSSVSRAFAGVMRCASSAEGHAIMVAATTDGVGTKTLLASAFGRWEVIGKDVVNHSLNDLLCAGAEPFFFMDYIAASKLEEDALLAIVRGMVTACADAGCPILGGETALMPDMYAPGAVEVVGTMLGTVTDEHYIGPHRVQPGDVLVGLPSSGLHTNGYSLVRQLFTRDELERYYEELGCPLAEALLLPHRSYMKEMQLARASGGLHAAAHITGGGLPGNLPRVLPENCMVSVDTGSWEAPPVFGVIQRKGRIPTQEMFQVFNMGVGMVLVMETAAAVDLLATLPDAWMMGQVLVGELGQSRLQFER
jgi:phosphoribosylformylglycinamidine cyclo-ligase